MKMLRCPDCRKHGVTLRYKPHGETGYSCRYCKWYAFVEGNDRSDVAERARLEDANPGWQGLAVV